MDLIDILWKQDIDMGVGREVYDPTLRMELERKQEQEQLIKQEQDPHLHPQTPGMPSMDQQHQQQLPWGTKSGKIDPETGEYLLPAEFFGMGDKQQGPGLMSPGLQPQQPQQPFMGHQSAPAPQQQQQPHDGPITQDALQRAFNQVNPEPTANMSRAGDSVIANRSAVPMINGPRDVLLQQQQQQTSGSIRPPTLLSQQSVEHTLSHLYDAMPLQENGNNVGNSSMANVNMSNIFLNETEASNNRANLSNALIHNTTFAPTISDFHRQPAPSSAGYFSSDADNDNMFAADMNTSTVAPVAPSMDAADMSWFNSTETGNETAPGTMGGLLKDLFEDSNNSTGVAAPLLDPETGEPGRRDGQMVNEAPALWTDLAMQAADAVTSASADLFDSSFTESSPEWMETYPGGSSASGNLSAASSIDSDYNETSDYGSVEESRSQRRGFFDFDMQQQQPVGHYNSRGSQALGATLPGAVAHNHTYTAPPGGVPHVRKMDMKAEKSHTGGTRDERRLMELGIPLLVDQIVSSAVEEFNDLLRTHDLNPAQLQVVRDIRRRGKNKVAAQNCRRRRLGAVLDIESRVDLLVREAQAAEQERDATMRALAEAKGRLAAVSHDVFTALRDEGGRAYSPREYALEVGPGGAAVLVRTRANKARDEGGVRRRGPVGRAGHQS